MTEKIKVRFKVRKSEMDFVNSYQFVGFVRGLVKCGYDITLENTIETLSTKEFYVIDVYIEEKCFEMAKGQAGSYGVIVEKVE